MDYDDIDEDDDDTSDGGANTDDSSDAAVSDSSGSSLFGLNTTVLAQQAQNALGNAIANAGSTYSSLPNTQPDIPVGSNGVGGQVALTGGSSSKLSTGKKVLIGAIVLGGIFYMMAH